MEAPPGGVDDMTKLSYLHEKEVLHEEMKYTNNNNFLTAEFNE